MGSVFSIQRGVRVFGASADVDTSASFTPVASLNNAFGRLTCALFAPTTDSSVGADRFNDDLGMRCQLTAVDTLTLTRLAAGENEDMRAPWEIWDMPSSGTAEIQVRFHGELSMSSGTGTVHEAIASIGDLSKCVPIVCGVTNTNTTEQWDRALPTVEMDSSPSNGVRVRREDTGDDTVVTVAVLEFVGSDYSVQNNIAHVFSGSGSDETETITSVDWSKTIIFPSFRTNSGNEDELGFTIRPGSSGTEIAFRRRSGATGTAIGMAHLVTSSHFAVSRYDSITGGGTAFVNGDQTVNTTISAVADTGRTAVIGMIDSAGTGSNYPREFWNYRLTSTTNVEWYRGRTGQIGDWALQVVEFADLSGGGGGGSIAAIANYYRRMRGG